jgi:hypothetical protein
VVEQHHLPRACGLLTAEALGEQARVVLPAARQDAAGAVEPQDQGRALEGAEHEGEPARGADVGRRLVAAAREVEVDDRSLVEHAQRVEPLG